MNFLVIILAFMIVWRVCRGFKNGFAKEVNRLISVFMALIVLSVTILLIASIMRKTIKTIIVATVLLIVISMVYRLINIIMKSVETIANLPIISIVNKLLGMAAGALEVLVVFWIMYVIIESFPTGQFGEQITTWTTQSTILVNIYNKNYIAHWITNLL